MKILKKLLLIHWHFFEHELIEFDILNFLTGKNTAGKSTIIDALQLVFLADTSNSYFNKSAKGEGKTKGSRTLRGYLRGEFGDDGDTGFRYLRNSRFTSYIALEFYDDIKNSSFTSGCCFDFYSDNDIPRLFFIYDGKIPENEFVVDSIPMDAKSLRQFIKNYYPKNDKNITETNQKYRDELYSKLGGLSSRFAKLLRTAIPFNPIVDIQQFITDFICEDQKKVDVSIFQEYIRSYKALEAEANILEKRKNALEEIINTHERYIKQKNYEILYSFLIERARLQAAIDKKSGLETELADNISNIGKLTSERSALKEFEERLRHERDQKMISLSSNKIASEIRRLNEEKQKIENSIQIINKSFTKVVQTLDGNFADWNIKLDLSYENLKELNIHSFDEILAARIDLALQEFQAFRKDLVQYKNISADKVIQIKLAGLTELASRANNIAQNAASLQERLDDMQREFAKQHSELKTVQQKLQSGIRQFPPRVVDLREAILSELRRTNGSHVKVQILAEIIEIVDERWTNVIEGYIHNQKYYLLVEPKYLRQALRVYDHIKEAKKIFGVGLIDVEKVIKKNPVANKGSLAEEIKTESLYARAYINFLLGRLMKCESVDTLRHHAQAITAEGMLYQGYVVSRINPKLWDDPVIGKASIIRQLEIVETKLKIVSEQVNMCSVLKQSFARAKTLKAMSQNDCSSAVDIAQEYMNIEELKKELDSIVIELSSIDDSPIQALKEAIDSLESQINACKDEYDDKKGKLSVLEKRSEVIDETDLPLCKEDIERIQIYLASNFSEDWISATGEPRYERERISKKSSSEIVTNYTRMLTGARNNKTNEWGNLKELRNTYNREYKMGFDVSLESNDIYENIWIELDEISLPEYTGKINDAHNKAFEQFQEDFLSRLQSNIRDAESQIDRLNQALKGYSFGDDRYRFSITPKTDYKRFYDMITSNMLLSGGYNLLSDQFNQTYKDEIDELFRLITENGDDYENRVKLFTNYQTYLSFDLEVIDKDGLSQRLSRTIGKKSGGETQTPFYVSVLASFAQLYGIGRNKSENTARIIIFDEAFSKMDEERISASIASLRKFGFQVILCAPPGKVPEISPVVDKTLCVIRQDKHSFVKSFGKAEVGELYDV